MEEIRGSSQVAGGTGSVPNALPQEAVGSSVSPFLGDNSNSVSMPICFLIREQAKSLIAIQELQKRMQHIEGVQEDVVTAIHDVHDYITVGTDEFSKSDKTSIKVPKEKFNSPQPLPLVLEKSFRNKTKSLQKCPTETTSSDHKGMGSMRAKHSAPESDKQDSGLDSDCRELGQENSHPQSESQYPYLMASPSIKKEPDELLELLDEIGEKSVILTQQVSRSFDNTELSTTPNLRQEIAAFRLEIMEVCNLMKDIKKERDALDKVLCGDSAIRRLSTETYYHRPVQFACMPLKNKESAYKVDPEIVSSVLKETNVTNLQKQVLTYMMENEVMKSKLSQMDEVLADKDLTERFHREEVSHLTEENDKLLHAFDELQMDNTSLACRVRMLEKVVHTMTVENRDLVSHLGETVIKSGMNRQMFSSLCSSKRCGQPAKELNVTCSRSKLLTNTSSFIDVSLQDEEDHDVFIPHFESGEGKSSTPLPTTLRKDRVTRFRSPLTSTSGNVNNRKINRRLTFNSMKSLASPEGCRTRTVHSPITNPSHLSATDSPLAQRLDRIPEKTGSEFPFYTILQKLKESSGCKLNKQDFKSRDSSPKCSSKFSSTKIEAGSSYHNSCNNSHREDGSSHKKNGAKTINKRIQDILDRITAESESASAV